MSENGSQLTLDQLIELFKAAAVKDVAGPGQEAAVDEINRIKRAIAERPGYMDRYFRLLSDAEPLVRYSAALSVKQVDPKAALAVFKELSDNDPEVGLLAWVEVRELGLKGYL